MADVRTSEVDARLALVNVGARVLFIYLFIYLFSYLFICTLFNGAFSVTQTI
jgi:hypothetical protein